MFLQILPVQPRVAVVYPKSIGHSVSNVLRACGQVVIVELALALPGDGDEPRAVSLGAVKDRKDSRVGVAALLLRPAGLGHVMLTRVRQAHEAAVEVEGVLHSSPFHKRAAGRTLDTYGHIQVEPQASQPPAYCLKRNVVYLVVDRAPLLRGQIVRAGSAGHLLDRIKPLLSHFGFRHLLSLTLGLACCPRIVH